MEMLSDDESGRPRGRWVFGEKGPTDLFAVLGRNSTVQPQLAVGLDVNENGLRFIVKGCETDRLKVRVRLQTMISKDMSYLLSLTHLHRLVPVVMMALVVSCAEPYGSQRVDAKVWRSSQPSGKQFAELKKSGVKEVLSLRSYHSNNEIEKDFTCHHVRMKAGKLNDEDMLEALRILVEAKEPIVVHCWHGADRTGAVIALYRMVVHRWPRERAIDELMKPEFGHHAGTFPNVREYLKNVDVEAMRRRLKLSGTGSVPAGIRIPPLPTSR